MILQEKHRAHDAVAVAVRSRLQGRPTRTSSCQSWMVLRGSYRAHDVACCWLVPLVEHPFEQCIRTIHSSNCEAVFVFAMRCSEPAPRCLATLGQLVDAFITIKVLGCP